MSYIDFEGEAKRNLPYFKPSSEGDIAVKVEKTDFIEASGLPLAEVDARLKTLNNESHIWDIPSKGIRARYWTNPKKETGITFERYFGAITARIVGIRFKDTPEIGKSMELVLRQDSGKEAIYTVSVKGQYFSGYAERLPLVDFDKPVRIGAYKTLKGDKKRYNATLEQDGKRIDSFFVSGKKDEKTEQWVWESKNGYPEVDQKELKKWGREEYFRSRYYPECSLFLVEYIETNVAPKVNDMVEVVSMEVDDDVTIVPDAEF
jgi:hypothetical protein